MKKAILIFLIVAVVFVAGYFTGRRRSGIQPLTSLRISELGLTKRQVDYGNKEMVQLWIPYGISGSRSGEDFVYYQKEIPSTDDELSVIKSAVELLLEGPSEEEKSTGAYSLVPGGKIKDIKIEDGHLVINFSQRFSPGGGSLAQWQARVAVEEVLRQFPSVKSVTILVEGRADALEP